MNLPKPNVSSFRSDALKDTPLGRLCGKEDLFCDRYKVLKMIGRGGYGVTFLVQDQGSTDSTLRAIKQLRPQISNPKVLENARQRFQREAKTLALLGNHAQIPALTDYFVMNEDFYLVQEYISGITLAKWIRRYGSQSEFTVKRFLREMLYLLQYVHNHQVIHRDIKPQNIILRQEDRHLVLIDFGAVKEHIAQAVEEETKMPTTHFVGTVGFAPPEQFSLRPVYGSDIYALGVTCLYMLTAKPPLDFSSDRRTGQLQWQNVVNISDSFQAILEKMLKPSLQDRYSSVTDILASLNEESPQDNLEQCVNMVRPSSKPTEEEAKGYFSFANKAIQTLQDWKTRFTRRSPSEPSSD